MSEKKRGRLIVYSGSSGVGKGTLLELIFKRRSDFCLSVSDTTRSPREGEVDGVNYNFVTREQFEKVIEQDGYLEYAEYCGNYYGTPKSRVYELLDSGRSVILEIEVQGALRVMKKYPDALSIFILPPSPQSLERRLRRRGTEDDDTIKLRLARAEEEAKFSGRYKYTVVNGELDKAVDELLDIFKKEIDERRS